VLETLIDIYNTSKFCFNYCNRSNMQWFIVFWDALHFISCINQNTYSSATLKIAELVLRPQSVHTNSQNQFRFRLIQEFLKFRPISLWINPRNSVSESVRSRISWSRGNWTGLRNWEEFPRISENSSRPNSRNRMELVPLAEMIPQCSASRNRMTVRINMVSSVIRYYNSTFLFVLIALFS
jgi:hypothetical protein